MRVFRGSLRMRARQTGPFVDPVCGMAVESGKGYVKRHQGREFHLCSEIRLAKFEANPERFFPDQAES
ncbi:YHS domain-containing protein [Methylococcus sp. ANG]|uniref:YHS domain-containing protein n=1 Tax=Methylococcus sp. ANG TaxID=3231903 RepID=UPI003457F23F